MLEEMGTSFRAIPSHVQPIHGEDGSAAQQDMPFGVYLEASLVEGKILKGVLI